LSFWLIFYKVLWAGNPPGCDEACRFRQASDFVLQMQLHFTNFPRR